MDAQRIVAEKLIAAHLKLAEHHEVNGYTGSFDAGRHTGAYLALFDTYAEITGAPRTQIRADLDACTLLP